MKPTQQEIIELAREAGIVPGIGDVVNGKYRPHKNALGKSVPVEWLQEFAKLLLERFGAGGGEPVAFVHWPLSGAPRLVWYGYKALNAAILKAYEGHQPDMLLYTHPSPTDLRAEYLRGLEDAAKVADAKALTWRVKPVPLLGYSAELEECAEKIRALKGKQ